MLRLAYEQVLDTAMQRAQLQPLGWGHHFGMSFAFSDNLTSGIWKAKASGALAGALHDNLRERLGWQAFTLR